MSAEMIACKIGLQAPVAALLGAAIGASAPAEISVGALGVAIAAMGIKIDNATIAQHVWDGIKAGYTEVDSLSEYLCRQMGAH